MTTRGTTLSALRGRRDFKSRALVYFLVLSLASPSHAVTLGTLKGYKGFQAAALAIANLNFAMQQASANPMDAWRRQNVAHAMGLLPLGIRALAEEFKSNKLHDADLKFVTGILGGFVDMSAPDKFAKFLKTPDKSLIPQLGANFPQEIVRQAEQQGSTMQSKSIVYDETAKGNEPALNVSSVPSASQQLANLSDVIQKGSKSSSGKSGEQRGSAVSKSTFFDEEAPKNPSGYKEFSAKAGNSESFESDVARDIASVESQLGLAQGRTGVKVIQAPTPTEKAQFSDDFFVEKKPVKKESVSKRDPANYKTKVRPKFWKVVPLMMLLMRDAKADGGAPTPAGAAAQAPAGNGEGGQGGSGCQGGGGCGGGGGQGGGGGGQGGGGADFLFGLAAIMAAVSPMVAAGIQAGADKKIAKINADAQITMSQIAADNSKYQVDSTSRIAEQQTKIAQDINKMNNDQQTQRLAMQLNEVKSGREQAYQSELAKRAEERKLNDERLALAQRQADDNVKLAQASFNAQLTQAGLSTGFSNATRPGGNLTVENKIQPGRTTASVASSAATGTNAIGGSFANSNLTGPNLAAGSTMAGTGTAGSQASIGQAAKRAIAASRLLASVGDEEEAIDPKQLLKKKRGIRRGIKGLRGIRGVSRGAYQLSNRGIALSNGTNGTAFPESALGSTRAIKVTENSKPTDLGRFNEAVSNTGFASFRRNEVPVVIQMENAVTRGVSPRGTSAYNPPSLRHGSGEGAE